MSYEDLVVGGITASYDTLMRQSPDTALFYLNTIESALSGRGKNYCETHQDLVIALLKVAAQDFAVSSTNKVLEAGLERIAEAIARLRRPKEKP